MDAKPEMPRVAKFGIGLLALEWIGSTFEIVLGWQEFVAEFPELNHIVLAILFAGLVLFSGLLIYLIATGRRWALVVSIVLVFLAIALILAGLIVTPTDELEPAALAEQIWLGVRWLLMLIGYGLLLTKPSRAWFAAWRKKRQRSASWEVAW